MTAGRCSPMRWHSSTAALSASSSPSSSAELVLASVKGGSDETAITASLAKALTAAYLGCFLFGYHMGVINAPLQEIASSLGFATSPAMQGRVVSSTLLGAFGGSLVGGGLADLLGRRGAMQSNALLLAAAALVCTLASSTGVLLLGRLLAGIGIGISGSIVPLFVAECSLSSQRGRFGSFNQVAICVGVLAAIVAGLPIGGVASTSVSSFMGVPWWRVMFGISVVPALAQIAVLALGKVKVKQASGPERSIAIESPRWLVRQKDRENDGIAIAKSLWGENCAAELSELVSLASVPRSSGASNGWRQLLGRRHWRGTVTGVLLFFFQQFAGINAVVFFSTKVFADAGLSSAVAASALVMVTNIMGTILAASVVDKLGRKPLLVGSFGGMSATMIAMAATLSTMGTAGGASTSFAGLVSLVFTVGYILSFSLGAGPIPSLLLGEMMPAEVRGKAASAAMASHWVCTFIVGQCFLSAAANFGTAAVYGAFGIVAALGSLFVATAVPETKGAMENADLN